MSKKKIKYQTLDEYVEERFKEQDEGALLMALRQVAKAKGGMAELAKKTNLSRESLYKTLSPTGNPRLRNLQRILEAFGYSLTLKLTRAVR